MKIADIEKPYKHKKSHCRYHIILVTKYRRKVITDEVKNIFIESFRACADRSNINIIAINANIDHIHLLTSFPPKYSIDQTVKRLKQFTTNYLYRSIELYLRKFYWKKKRILWSDSYFVSTIGEISEQKVLDYIEHQGN